MAHRTTRPISVGLVFVLVGFVLAAPASAADCGGATPCSCGDTVTASRTLVAGVDPVTTTTCTGDGLAITSGRLDLNGLTIRGSGAAGSVGISGEGAVRNGTIARFGTGISGDTDVERMEVVDNIGDGIVVASLFGPTVRTSTARRNGGIGILVGCGDLRDSHADHNGSHGIIISAPGCIATVSHVVSTRNGGSGFFVGGDTVRVDRSWAGRNVGHGYLITGQDVTATRSRAVENGGDGFAIRADFSVFSQLRTKGNAGLGIRDRVDLHPFANSYGPGNYCQGDALGDSGPPGLCK